MLHSRIRPHPELEASSLRARRVMLLQASALIAFAGGLFGLAIANAGNIAAAFGLGV